MSRSARSRSESPSGAHGRWIPVAFWISTLLLPEAVTAQPRPSETDRQDAGFHVGVSAGGYFEAAEGYLDETVAGSIFIGVGRAAWRFQVEMGMTGEHCTPGCDSHRLLNVGVARRFGTGPVRPYVTFGCCVVHAGAGAEIEIGRELWLAPGLDLNWAVYSASARPKMALVMRF